jgi:hypothetical protein
MKPGLLSDSRFATRERPKQIREMRKSTQSMQPAAGGNWRKLWRSRSTQGAGNAQLLTQDGQIFAQDADFDVGRVPAWFTNSI